MTHLRANAFLFSRLNGHFGLFVCLMLLCFRRLRKSGRFSLHRISMVKASLILWFHPGEQVLTESRMTYNLLNTQFSNRRERRKKIQLYKKKM